MSVDGFNRRVNWLQVIMIVLPLLVGLGGFARSIDRRVTVVEQRVEAHALVPAHGAVDSRLDLLESKAAAYEQSLIDIKANQAEIKVLLRDLRQQLNHRTR